MIVKTSVIFILCCVLLLLSCKSKPVNEGLPLIIDADTANEVDDLYAIVRAIKAPELNLLGITSAQFHTSPLASDSTVYESQKINQEIIDLLDIKDLPLPLGANAPIESITNPQSSAAADFIIEQARDRTVDDPLHIACLLYTSPSPRDQRGSRMPSSA